MDEGPIKLGSLLFTLVEPHRDHVVDYNRWYERDHFYAGCLVGPGILAGRRWVATRELKKLRFPAESPVTPNPMTGSYLATYFIEASGSREWGTWAAAEVHRLHEAGRMFPHRDHVHTQMYVYRGAIERDAAGVPPALALDHPFPCLVATVVEGAPRREVASWLASDVMPGLVKDSPIALSLAFTAIPVPGDSPEDVPPSGANENRILHLHFIDSAPTAAWQRFSDLGDTIDASGRARLVWAAPFIPTIPGTDTYTDQLW